MLVSLISTGITRKSTQSLREVRGNITQEVKIELASQETCQEWRSNTLLVHVAHEGGNGNDFLETTRSDAQDGTYAAGDENAAGGA